MEQGRGGCEEESRDEGHLMAERLMVEERGYCSIKKSSLIEITCSVESIRMTWSMCSRLGYVR